MQVNKATHYHKFTYLPEGYEPFLSSDKLGLSESGYYGIAAINKKNKQIIICNAGTKIDPENPIDIAFDLVSDAQISQGKIPEQYKFALKFAEYCLEKMPDDYNITITGFSLGAVLADLVTYKLASKYPGIDDITFENPGSSKIIANKFANKVADAHFTVYNAAIPNLVNIFGHKNQIGETHLVCLDKSKFSDDMGKIGNALLAGHAFANFSEGAFDDDGNIKLCGQNGMLEEVLDTLSGLFS